MTETVEPKADDPEDYFTNGRPDAVKARFNLPKVRARSASLTERQLDEVAHKTAEHVESLIEPVVLCEEARAELRAALMRGLRNAKIEVVKDAVKDTVRDIKDRGD